MGNDVFANGREISCKAAEGKSICAFPDVCFTPPENPATPPGVPVPYPNTGMASDTTEGSKTVTVSGQEVMLKNKSYFKKSTGDEAGCAAKKGVLTSTNRGKVYFTSWSMDVKFEGENVVRHLDLTTHNHMSFPGNTPPWAYADTMAMFNLSECAKDADKAKTACSPWKQKSKCPSKRGIKRAEAARASAKKTFGEGSPRYRAAQDRVNAAYQEFASDINDNDCHRALKCVLVPYKPNRCCPGQTGDHVIDAASFLEAGSRKSGGTPIAGWKKYDVNKAPCVCAEGPNQYTATHGQMHTRKGVAAMHHGKDGKWDRKQAAKAGARAVCKTFPDSGCSQECIEKQLNDFHDKAATTDPEKPVNANVAMTTDEGARSAARVDMGIPSAGPAATI